MHGKSEMQISPDASVFNGHLLQVGVRCSSNSTQQLESITHKPENKVHTLNKSDTQSSADKACGEKDAAFPVRRRSTSFIKSTATTANTGPTEELQQKLNHRLSRVEDPKALEDFESQISSWSKDC